MKKFLILIFLLVPYSVPTVQKNTDFTVPQKQNEFRVITPEAQWGSIYFQEINKQVSRFQLDDLRARALPEGDLKIRIWIGWGLGSSQVFILNKESDKWSAKSLATYQQSPKVLPPPKSGWENVWQKLVDAGLLTLPDQEELDCEIPVIDGQYYVVEYNLNNTYRTYKYSEGQLSLCKEAEQMMKIRNVIADEFGSFSTLKSMEDDPEVLKYFNRYKEIRKQAKSN